MPWNNASNQPKWNTTIKEPKIWRPVSHMQSTTNQICNNRPSCPIFLLISNSTRQFSYFLFLFNQDKKADLVISTYVDDILEKVLKRLGVELPDYSTESDPTKQRFCELEWTIPSDILKKIEKMYNEKVKLAKKRKSTDDLNDEKKKEKKSIIKAETKSDS